MTFSFHFGRKGEGEKFIGSVCGRQLPFYFETSGKLHAVIINCVKLKKFLKSQAAKNVS